MMAVLTSAFVADPACRWMYPNEDQYRTFFPAFAEVFGGAALDRQTALLAEREAGAALWLPPDTSPDEEALGSLVGRSVEPSLQTNAYALFEEMGRLHPREPHWYLPLIGVVPERQGLGFGSAMMEMGLGLCDEQGLPAYLEATSARSIPLYQRHGFEVVGEIRIGTCPPIVPMLRMPTRHREGRTDGNLIRPSPL
jgi:ribosomal protein S18 acetylase RimI-like enzyme